MKAVGVKDGKGDADALYIEEVPDPVLEEDNVLVRVKAFGLNRMDITQREARYPYAIRPHWGKIMGVELSGIVEGLGPECGNGFKVGDKVFSLIYGGAYAEKICVSEKMLMHMPPSLSHEEAAGAPETYFTALQAIQLLGDMQPGKTVLIHAGASGVGLSAIQVAKILGASKIITTAGSDEKCRVCESVGADFAINYRTTDFAPVVEKETNGAGVHLIVDMVGRDYWSRNIQVAATDSRMVIVAVMSGGQIEDFSLRHLMNKRICLMTTTLRTRDSDYQVRLRNTFVEKIMPHLADGRAKTVVDKVFDWSDISDAHKRMESNSNAGKIICTIPS